VTGIEVVRRRLDVSRPLLTFAGHCEKILADAEGFTNVLHGPTVHHRPRKSRSGRRRRPSYGAAERRRGPPHRFRPTLHEPCLCGYENTRVSSRILRQKLASQVFDSRAEVHLSVPEGRIPPTMHLRPNRSEDPPRDLDFRGGMTPRHQAKRFAAAQAFAEVEPGRDRFAQLCLQAF
jgi:hypothetical protein